MNLEAMNKKELIEMIKELKLKLDQKVDVVETALEKAQDLPFSCKSVFRHRGGIKVATIKFNPLTKEAQVLPELKEYSNTQMHMATFEAKKHLVETSMKQEIKEEQ
jgi:uncharacterized protein (DUF1919 family)